MIIHHVTKSEFGKLSGKVVDYKGQEAKIDGNNVYLTKDSKKESYESKNVPINFDGKEPEPDYSTASETSSKRKSKS